MIQEFFGYLGMAIGCLSEMGWGTFLIPVTEGR